MKGSEKSWKCNGGEKHAASFARNPLGSLLGLSVVGDALISLWGVPMIPIPRIWEVAKLPPKAGAFHGLLDSSAHRGEAGSYRLPPPFGISADSCRVPRAWLTGCPCVSARPGVQGVIEVLTSPDGEVRQGGRSECFGS